MNLKLIHQSGLRGGTPRRLIETLRLMDGSNAVEVANTLYYDPSTIRYRIDQLEKLVGGLVLNRAIPNGQIGTIPASLTELGREVLAANEDLI